MPTFSLQTSSALHDRLPTVLVSPGLKAAASWHALVALHEELPMLLSPESNPALMHAREWLQELTPISLFPNFPPLKQQAQLKSVELQERLPIALKPLPCATLTQVFGLLQEPFPMVLTPSVSPAALQAPGALHEPWPILAVPPPEPALRQAILPLQEPLRILPLPPAEPRSRQASKSLQESEPMRVPSPRSRHAPSALHERCPMTTSSPSSSKLQ
jgi:hypothetical protein